MIDVLSDGRLILGLGISNAKREFVRHGLNIKNQVALFEEGIEILRRAWTEDVFSFYGRNYSIKNERVTPRPIQKPHPPLWLGAGTPFGFRRAARLGLPVFSAGLSSRGAGQGVDADLSRPGRAERPTLAGDSLGVMGSFHRTEQRRRKSRRPSGSIPGKNFGSISPAFRAEKTNGTGWRSG